MTDSDESEMDRLEDELLNSEKLEDDIIYELAFSKADDFYSEENMSVFEAGTDFAANVTLAVALTNELNPETVALLRDFYLALTGDGQFKLTLSNSKRGRSPSAEQKRAREAAARNTLRLVELVTKMTGKREAAVAKVGEILGVSRATIFKDMSIGRAALVSEKKAQILEKIIEESGVKEVFR
jgi:hypothetical protein